jgi:uncharacterized protein with GYD domain
MREGRSLVKTLSQVVARMPLYLSRFSYATEAKKALLSQPQDRSGAAREMAESLGGKLLGFWYAFGEFDGVFLLEAPDNAAAAAVGMAVGASGALSEIETTVLLDMDEAQDAMRKAAAATYKPQVRRHSALRVRRGRARPRRWRRGPSQWPRARLRHAPPEPHALHMRRRP